MNEAHEEVLRLEAEERRLLAELNHTRHALSNARAWAARSRSTYVARPDPWTTIRFGADA